MLARSVVIDVDAPCDEVVARIRARLQGDLSPLSELLVPVSKVGAGPPDFVGRVVGLGHLYSVHANLRDAERTLRRTLRNAASTPAANTA